MCVKRVQFPPDPVLKRGDSMTAEEFDRTAWSAKMTCSYQGISNLPIVSVDFEERLIGLGGGNDGLVWVRCESVTGVKATEAARSAIQERLKSIVGDEGAG
jgi:hypothetical protein